MSLPTWNDDYEWQAGHGYFGWQERVTAEDQEAYGFARGFDQAPGLWLWPNGGREHRLGMGEWIFRAPGTTRIATADFTTAYVPKLFAHHCLQAGLSSGAEQRAEVRHCRPPAANGANEHQIALQVEDPSSEPTATQAHLSVLMPPCQNPDEKPCSKHLPDHDPQAQGPFARSLTVRMVLVDDDLPVVVASGPFADLDGRYINGRELYPLHLDASDAGAGVKTLRLEHEGHADLGEFPADCDPTHNTEELGSLICPQQHEADIEIDTRPMPEGTRRFRFAATDLAGNVGEKRMTVIVDRTPPTIPVTSVSTPEEGSVQAEWLPSTDPLLPDGTPGSGVAGYRVRYRINDGIWSDWTELTTTDNLSKEVFDQPDGTDVAFEVVAYDAVGNASAPAFAEFAAYGDPPVVRATGSLADMSGEYVGYHRLGLHVDATDEGTGLTRLYLATSAGELWSQAVPCAPGFPKRTCPAQATGDLELDATNLPQGVIEVRADATDRAGNTGDSETWFLLVDHSAPAPATNIAFEAYDAEMGEVRLDWDDGLDPEIAPEVPGAGVHVAEYRIARNGEWTGWLGTDDGELRIDGLTPGDHLDIELRMLDLVGNRSSVSTASYDVPLQARVREHGDDAEPASDQHIVTRSHGGFPRAVNCTPRIKLARTHDKPQRPREFKSRETRLGAKIAVMCFGTLDSDRVEITSAFAVRDGEDEDGTPLYRRVGRYGIGGTERYHKVLIDPRNRYDVDFLGTTTPCELQLAGTRKYLVIGEMTFIENYGTSHEQRHGPHEYYTDFNKPKSLTCPTAAERARRDQAAWLALRHYAADLDDDSWEIRPAVQLAKVLNKPSVPHETRVWAAHHIVPHGDPRAFRLQVTMFRCKVHPNEERNGIYLRMRKLRSDTQLYEDLKRTHPGLAARTYHADTSYQEYFDILHRRFGSAVNVDDGCTGERDNVIDALESLKTDLAWGALNITNR